MALIIAQGVLALLIVALLCINGYQVKKRKLQDVQKNCTKNKKTEQKELKLEENKNEEQN